MRIFIAMTACLALVACGGGGYRKAARDVGAKLIYLAIRNFEKGGRNVREWFAARNQFAIMFGERFNA